MNNRRGKYGRRSSRPAGAADSGGSRTPRSGGRSGRPQAQAKRPQGPSSLQAGRVVEGTVSAHRAGYGFLRVEGSRDSIFLSPPEMRGVMHGDRVRARLSRDASERWSAAVETVTVRAVTAFLGTIEIEGRASWVHAADRRLQLRCAVSRESLGDARDGDWVIARITRHASGGGPAHAQIDRRLDPDRPLELSTEAAIARFDLPGPFPEAVEREAAAWGTSVDPLEANSRIDLRGLPLVTIDGEDARDFDDAVYAEALPDGFRLIVAIADVSHYVRPGSALDTEAVLRGTSVYFPQRVLPMLPPALSDHLCSLAPHVDRLCFVADMVVTSGGMLKEVKCFPAVMRSAARLTYTLAHAALFERRPEARAELGAAGRDPHLADRLDVLVEVYRALLKARRRRGALDFDAPEAGFRIDAEGHVRGVELKYRNEAHKLVEECMILANVAVARGLGEQHRPTLYRVHGKPEAEKLERLIGTLAWLGIDAQLPQDVTTRDLQAIARRVSGGPERAFVESLLVRSLQQALYQPENIGHFGLALGHYAHFTSPIRRYPDLLVHRTLKALIGAPGGAGRAYDTGELAVLGESSSRLEKRADEASRYVATFLKCSWLRERIGQSFQGLVTTVVEFGCFVQLIEPQVDGLLHVDSLRDDEYEMEDGGHAWRGRRTGRRLAIGAHLRVIVTAVNPIEGLIDLELEEEALPEAHGTAPRGRRRRT